MTRHTGFCGLALLFAILLLLETVAPSSSATASSGSAWGNSVLPPEDPTGASFGLWNDWQGRPRVVVGTNGVVASDHGRCAQLALGVLKKGGNAVDASVTLSLCQGIMNPGASGVGGGHFAVILSPDGRAIAINARDIAPAAANQTMFSSNPELSKRGGLAIAIPVELLGLHTAHALRGALTWKDVVLPVVPLARDGFPAHPYLVQQLTTYAANLTAIPALRDALYVQDVNGTWRAPKVNETCCQRPAFAALLTDVANDGVDVLYNGSYTQQLADDIQAAGGIITADDLRSATATVQEPIVANVLGMKVYLPPPPSSAVTLMPALSFLAGYDVPAPVAGLDNYHRVVEAMKHAYAIRLHLGDPGVNATWRMPDNITQLVQTVLKPSFVATLRCAGGVGNMLASQPSTHSNATGAYDSYGGRYNVLDADGAPPDDHGTSHMSVVDSMGNAVSLTSTINMGFGSWVMSPSTGILLNNQMDDFSSPGQVNAYGYPPSPANYIAPGKRPLSSMSPMVWTLNGTLRGTVGASGGSLILSAILQTLHRVMLQGLPAYAAVADPRVHDQLANVTFVEDWSAGNVSFRMPVQVRKKLESWGHKVESQRFGAVTQLVLVDPDDGAMLAVSDPRKDGSPAAY